MKNVIRIAVCVLVFCAFGQSAQAQGIPVEDNAALLQMVQQAAQMAKDYEQFQAQTQSMTGQLSSFKNVSNANAIQSAVNAGQQVMQQLNAAYGSGAPTDYSTRIGATTNAVQAANTQQTGQQNNLNTEAQRINDLAAQSQAAQGTLQAQQAGNQINVELVQQLQLQRAQQLIQAQAQNAALLQQQQKDADKAALTNDFLGKSGKPVSTDEMLQKYSPSLVGK